MRNLTLARGEPTTRSVAFGSEHGPHKTLYLVLLGSGALAISAFSLKALPMPFVWINIAWAGALMGALFYFEGSWPRAFLFNIGFAFLLVAACEAYLSLREMTLDQPRYYNTFFVKDDLL